MLSGRECLTAHCRKTLFIGLAYIAFEMPALFSLNKWQSNLEMYCLPIFVSYRNSFNQK